MSDTDYTIFGLSRRTFFASIKFHLKCSLQNYFVWKYTRKHILNFHIAFIFNPLKDLKISLKASPTRAATYAFRQYDHPSRKVHKNKTKQGHLLNNGLNVWLFLWSCCLGLFFLFNLRHHQNFHSIMTSHKSSWGPAIQKNTGLCKFQHPLLIPCLYRHLIVITSPLGPSLPWDTFWYLSFQVVTRSALTLPVNLLAWGPFWMALSRSCRLVWAGKKAQYL